MPAALLAPLPYENWEPTKTTLHLWSQIVGKLRLGYTPHRNHWWNVTLIPTARGLSTLRMRDGETFFEVELDLIDHRCIVRSNRAHAPLSFALEDGLSVAAFYRTLFGRLGELGIRAHILAKPYGVQATTPFPEDEQHRSYDRVMVRRWFDVIVWSADVLETFAGEFLGKESPAHLFWHSFDLALARYSGRAAGGPPKNDPVEREAYSHEVIAFGFWAGDEKTRAPAYYTYTAPEPADLTREPLEPFGAVWSPSGNGHLGTLPYEAVRTSPDPRATLLAFFRAGYAAGTRTAHWDAAALGAPFA